MALSARLDVRQSQNLVMTPQLQQAIKLLQLSGTELVEYVEGELQENPLLERDEGQGDGPDPNAPDTPDAAHDGFAADGDADTGGDPDAGPIGEPDAASLIDGEGRLPGDGEAPLDADLSQTYDGDIAGPGGDAGVAFDSLPVSGAGGRRDFADDENDPLARLSREPSLREKLLEQLRLDIPDPGDRLIGLALIDAMDDAGYLPRNLTPLVAQLGCTPEALEGVLAALQQFEPAGLFARSLAECLKLQLIARNRYDPAMATLLDNLALLARRDAAGLMKLCGVDKADLADMVAEIRALDPKPAAGHDDLVTPPVIPDVLMHPGPDGDWIVELNPQALPRVLVNESFYAGIAGQSRERGDRDYLSERYQSANWLVKSLHQRANTILKVARELVRQQGAFFRHGVSGLKPLVLRDIAEAIEMHESTVSRVTSNKYIATPRGMFELKYFFTTGLTGLSGGVYSAESIRHRIRSLIDGEPPARILSDDKLVELLREEGIDIARRTVAKYRESMNIASSIRRRREKNAAL